MERPESSYTHTTQPSGGSGDINRSHIQSPQKTPPQPQTRVGNASHTASVYSGSSSIPCSPENKAGFSALVSTTTTTKDDGDVEDNPSATQDVNSSTRTSLLDALLAADEDSFNISMGDLMASFSFSLDQQPPTPSPEPGEIFDGPAQESKGNENEHIGVAVDTQQDEPQQQRRSQSAPRRRRRLILSEEPENDDDWMVAREYQPQDLFVDHVVEASAGYVHRQIHPDSMEEKCGEGRYEGEEGEEEEEQYRSQASSFISDHHFELEMSSTLYPPGQRVSSLSSLPESSSLASTIPTSPRFDFEVQQDDVEGQKEEEEGEETGAATHATVALASPPTVDSLEGYFLGQDAIFHSQEFTQEYQSLPPVVNAAAAVSANDTGDESNEEEPLSKRQKAAADRFISRGTTSAAGTDMDEDVADTGATSTVPIFRTSAKAVIAALSPSLSRPSPPRPATAAAAAAGTARVRMAPIKNPILPAELTAPFPTQSVAGRTTADPDSDGAPGPSSLTSLSSSPSSSSSKTAATGAIPEAVLAPSRSTVAVGATITTAVSPRPKRVHIPLVFEERPPATALATSATGVVAPSMATTTASENGHDDRVPRHHATTATVELMRELAEVNRDFGRRSSSTSSLLASSTRRRAAEEERYSLTQTTFYKQRQPGYIPVPSFRPRYQRSRKKKTIRERVDSPRGVKFPPLVVQPTLNDDSDILLSQPLSASQRELPAPLEAA
ncbi:hypothetical protein DFQ27_004172 [Actinomortierella ambigua]|uniref:Uncharacterized protein n=1 Tax=Actinomortierella ambigua TaxID=1343610 RepID=A0A9P6U4W3_9FUNG|nr:hypothetical protein DFQ27_004172 [Actinomortierella ambigua]